MSPVAKIFHLYRKKGRPEKFFKHLYLCKRDGIVRNEHSYFLMAAPWESEKGNIGWFVYGASSEIGIKELVKQMPYELPYLFWRRYGQQRIREYQTQRVLNYVS